MVHVVLGRGLPEKGKLEVPALTLGQLIERLGKKRAWVHDQALVFYVNGQSASSMEGPATPVDEEDTVLVVPAGED